MITEIFFRLLNFAVLMAVLAYLFKQYVLQPIKDSMQAQKAIQHALEQERDSLAERQRTVDQEIVAQEQLREQLMQKVHLWQTYFEGEKQKRFLEKTAIKKQLVEKVHHQQKIYALNKAQKMILPFALEKTREKLQKDFENQQKGQAYNRAIFNYLENA